MAARITQQFVEVLADGDAGTLRLTQQYVEVLGTIPVASTDVDGESAIAITDLAVATGTISAAGTSELVFTELASTIGPHYASASSNFAPTQVAESETLSRSAESTLTLTDEAAAGEFLVVAEDTLTLSDEARSSTIDKAALSTLSVTQTATQIGVITQIASSALTLDSVASTLGPINVSATSEITLVSTGIGVGSPIVTATSTLELTDSNTVMKPIYVSALSEIQIITYEFNLDTFEIDEIISGLDDLATFVILTVREVVSLIPLSHQATSSLARADGIDCDAESVLSLVDEGQVSLTGDGESILNLEDLAEAQTGIGLVSDLSSLDVQADATITRAVIAESSLSLSQAIAFFVDDDDLCGYKLSVGANDDPDAPTPPPTSYTAAGATPGFRLQFPSSGTVTDEVILRAPNLGNRDRLSMVRINRETRGGTLIVFADPIWPKVETLLLSFSGLSETEAHSLLTFMEGHIGQEIRLIDWEDRLWSGVIVNPQDPIVQDGKGCQYTASFEFEGEKV